MSDQLTGFAIIPADLARTPAVTAQAKAAYAALTFTPGREDDPAARLGQRGWDDSGSDAEGAAVALRPGLG